MGLPPGLTLSPEGVLSGTPTTPGTYSFPVTVTDSDGYTATATLTMIVAPPLVITVSGLGGVENQAFTFQLQGTGGFPPFTWAAAVGVEPMPEVSLAGNEHPQVVVSTDDGGETGAS